MNFEERESYWEMVESGDNPLLSTMHSLVERWGLPAIVMSLGDVSRVLIDDAEDAELTPNQRGLIIGACAAVCNLSDQMHAEMEFLESNK